MTAIRVIGFLGGWLLSQVLPSAAVPTDKAQKQAVEHLRAGGAKIRVDSMAPGKPAVKVEFYGSERDFAWIAHLPTVRKVVLGGCDISSAHLQHLSGLKELTSLELWGPGILVSDKGLKRVGRLTQLREVHLYNMHVTDAGLKHLGKLKNLESLTVTEVTKPSGVWLRDLKGLTKLRKLDLTWARISDQGVAFLSKLPALEVLDVQGCYVTDRCLNDLQKMRKLKRVTFGNTTEVTERGLQVFRQERPDVKVEYNPPPTDD